MLSHVLDLLFPPKCILCRKILSKDETDICHTCRKHVQEFSKAKRNLSFVAQWTAVWYYSGDVRRSILRYKFYNARNYAKVYGRFLALKLQQEMDGSWDILSYIPISPFRRFTRGYDQVELLAEAVASELGISMQRVLRKIRNTPPQSGITDAARRRANISGAYEVIDPAVFSGKRVLLLDDVITTGATASECARTLLTAGADQVRCAAIAVADHKKK